MHGILPGSRVSRAGSRSESDRRVSFTCSSTPVPGTAHFFLVLPHRFKVNIPVLRAAGCGFFGIESGDGGCFLSDHGNHRSRFFHDFPSESRFHSFTLFETAVKTGVFDVDQERAAGFQRRCGAVLNYLVSVSPIRRSIRRTAVVHGLDAAAIIPVCSICFCSQLL